MMYIIKVSLCWLFFYLFYAFFLRKETFFRLNRWYLMGTFLLSLTLPILELPKHEISKTVELVAVYIHPISTTLQTIEVTATSSSVLQEGMSVSSILQFIYFVGVGLLFGRLVWSLLKLYLLYHRSTIEKHDDFILVITPEVHLPFSFFRYLFWSEKHQLSISDKAKIIQHEKVHMQQGHSFDVLLIEFISVFLWCSPLIYFYKKSLRIVHEYLADAAVIKNTPIQTYGKLLLSQSMSGLKMPLANHFFQSPLKNRIIMMTKSKSPTLAMFKYVLTLPLILAIVLIFSSKNLLAQEQSSSSDEEIYKVVEEMPRFPGCEENPLVERKECAQMEMLHFIYNHVKYPKDAREAGIQGTVVVQFIIDKTGHITKPKIKRSLGNSCDEEVLKVINLMPQWIPGKQKGQNVAVQYNLPVKFKLDNSSTKKKENNLEIEEVFKVVEQMPVFPGCEDLDDFQEQKDCGTKKLLEFIFGNIKYPEEARKLGVEGIVLAKFIVQKDGSIDNIHITRSIGSGTDEEVLRVAQLMADLPEKWTPGVQKGENVAVEFVLPIKFKLADPTEEEIKNEGLAQPREALTLINYMASPNPSSGQVNLQFEADSKPLVVELLDMNGRVLDNRTLNNFNGQFQETFDLSQVAKGTLIIKVSQAGQFYFNKVVVQ